MEDFAQYAIVAAKEALEDSGLDMEKEDPFMVGCSVGCGIGSLQCVQKNYEKILTKGPNRVAPLMFRCSFPIWQPEIFQFSLD